MAAAATYYCPICRVTYSVDQPYSAEAHFWFQHFRKDRDHHATCRCGKQFGPGRVTLDEIMAHIEAEGGLEAHWLACELGGDHG